MYSRKMAMFRSYCFTTPDNLTIEQEFPMGEAPGKIKLPNGETAYRDYQAEGVTGTVRGTSTPIKRPWPMTCHASGVHPSQANELRKHLKERGCPTEVTPGGDPVYTSAAHRKKALKIRGFHDKASYT